MSFNKLTQTDFCEAAQSLECSAAAIKSVALVESGGRGGFDEKGRVLLRYEGHKFREFTGGKFDQSHPHVSYVYHKSHKHCGNVHGYTAFNEAMKLDAIAAMKSCSIGMFQPMVFNYHEMGFHSIGEMFDFLKRGEREQLIAFVRLIKHWGLDDELRRATLADFMVFAARYNGKNYRDNNYHVKMLDGYLEYKKLNIDCRKLLAESLPDAEEVGASIDSLLAETSDVAESASSRPSDELQQNSASQPQPEPETSDSGNASSSGAATTEPTGDKPTAPPKVNIEVEDWKPWVFSKLKWTWTSFTGVNFTQTTGNGIAALKSGEYWYVPVIIWAITLIFTLIVCVLLSLALLAIWYFNRKEIVHFLTERIKTLTDPEKFNLGLHFDTKY